MKGFGQYCAIARALELLAERWSLLIVRELMCGAETFGDVRRGIPRISRTMLAARLRVLCEADIVARSGPDSAPRYALTERGRELAPIVMQIGQWGQRWLPRELPEEHLDVDLLLWDMQRRARPDQLPRDPFVVRIELADVSGAAGRRFLLMRPSEVSACHANAGFPERLAVRTPRGPLFAWWRGDVDFAEARRGGLTVVPLDDPDGLAPRFPDWFDRYALADVPPALG